MCQMCDEQMLNDTGDNAPNSVTEIVAKAFEEACIGLHVCDDADGMACNIGDAVAHYRHESDLSGAREVIYDQSGDAAAAIMAALTEAGYAIVQVARHPCDQCNGRGFQLDYVEQGSAIVAMPGEQCERCAGEGSIPNVSSQENAERERG